MYRLNGLVSRQSVKALNEAIKTLRIASAAASQTTSSSASFSTKTPGDEAFGTAESSTASSSSTAAGASQAAPFAVLPPPPDREISLLGPKDARAPLPGNVGLFPFVPPLNKGVSRKPVELSLEAKVRRNSNRDTDVLTGELASDRHLRVMEHVLYPNQYDDATDAVTEEEEMVRMRLSSQERFECVAFECPELLCRDFQDLFPKRNLGKELTVLTVTQKTRQDMSAWSPDMESEREIIIEQFIDLAQALVQRLNAAGYWADFLDPFSGRPFLGAYTNATMFETDERYRHFGFELEDLGCCKVIRHHTWGSKSFVGCLFTNAPVSSSGLENVLSYLEKEPNLTKKSGK